MCFSYVYVRIKEPIVFISRIDFSLSLSFVLVYPSNYFPSWMIKSVNRSRSREINWSRMIPFRIMSVLMTVFYKNLSSTHYSLFSYDYLEVYELVWLTDHHSSSLLLLISCLPSRDPDQPRDPINQQNNKSLLLITWWSLLYCSDCFLILIQVVSHKINWSYYA
jgi:hypothetical protein